EDAISAVAVGGRVPDAKRVGGLDPYAGDRLAGSGVAHNTADRASGVHLDGRPRVEEPDALVSFRRAFPFRVEIAVGPARPRVLHADRQRERVNIVAG